MKYAYLKNCNHYQCAVTKITIRNDDKL